MDDVREMAKAPKPETLEIKPEQAKRKRTPKPVESSTVEPDNFMPYGEFVLLMAESVVRGGGIGKLSRNGMLAFDINVRAGYQRVMDVIKRGPDGDA